MVLRKILLSFLIICNLITPALADDAPKKFGFHLNNNTEYKNQIINKIEQKTISITDEQNQTRNLDLLAIDTLFVHKNAGENIVSGALTAGIGVGVTAGQIMAGAILSTVVLAPLAPFVFVGSVISLMIPGAIVGAVMSIDETHDLSQMSVDQKSSFIKNLTTQKAN